MRLAMKVRVAELKVAEAEQAVAEQSAVIGRLERQGQALGAAQVVLFAHEGQLAIRRADHARLLQLMDRVLVG